MIGDPMQRITPNLWFNRTAAEAGDLYASVFPNASSDITMRYPTEGLPDFQRDLAGEPLVVDVTIGDSMLRLINAGDEFRPNPSLSLIVSVDPSSFGDDEDAARSALDAMFSALSDSGEVRMPLGEYPFSARYGWVEDRFGVSWQLMLVDPSAGPPPSVVPQLLFTGSTPRAREAIDLYTNLFQDAAVGTLVPAPDTDAVMFAEFTLAGQRFSAMDGGTDHAFTFTPGVSLEVACDDQAEIDRLWDALSAVPEAEQCGWLVDRFGVSWQIVPSAMDELLTRPDAYRHMLSMKKIVIADL